MRLATDKMQTVTVFLLKENITTINQAIKPEYKLHRYDISPDLPFAGALYVEKAKSHPPSWLPFVNTGLVTPLSTKPNTNTSSLLEIRIDSRIFAIAFGYGRHFLEPESYEMDFGLRVALNSVDADRLRSVDVQACEELALHTRLQTSHSSSLDTFGLDASRDLLRLVTGEPRDASFAKRITGADSLTLAAPLPFKSIGKKCTQMLDFYISDTYKVRFGWVDHLKRVRAKDLKQKLIDKLLEELKANNYEKLYLAPPEIIDWQIAGGFKYSTISGVDQLSDLDLHDYVNTLPDVTTISYEKLKKDKVECYYLDSDQQLDNWTVFNCLVFETEYNGNTYALVSGEWYEIHVEFVERVNSTVAGISAPSVLFPDALKNEKEGDYNIRASKLLSDAVLLDCKCPAPNGAHSGIEICDIFTGKCQFIHIKRSDRSSTLSHLFAQGTNSATAFLSDEKYRRLTREHIKKSQPKLANSIPDARPDPNKFEVGKRTTTHTC